MLIFTFPNLLNISVYNFSFPGIGSDQPNKCIFNQEDMQHRASLLKRVLDAKVDRETQALYAIQSLIHKLEHPTSKYISCVLKRIYPIGGGIVQLF